MRKTNVCAPLVGEVVDLILISTNRQNPTDYVAGLVLENCACYDKMIGVTEINKPLTVVVAYANVLVA